MKKYVATKRGYDGVKVREVGEIFDFEGKPGSWMKELEEAPKKAESKSK